MEELWDIARVAEYLGVSERTVYNRVRAGELPAIKMGRLWRVRPSELERWLGTTSRGSGRGPEAPVGVPGPYPYPSDTEPLPRVAEAAPRPARDELERRLGPLTDQLERRLAFVGLLTRAVESLGWPAPVVVGGHAVEFYTAGDYPTVDIDLAGASEPLAEVLAAWGFSKEGRHWFDESLRLLVEAPGSRPGPDELAHVVAVRVGAVTAYVIGIEDIVVDRLCAAKFWNDDDARFWAGTMLAVAQELDQAYLERRAADEDVADELARLLAEGGR
jgi:excisionase family DNA binding protein